MTTIEAGARSAGAGSGKILKWPILLGSVAVMLLSYLWMPVYPEYLDEVGYMLRVTARLAFILLMLAYLARPMQRAFGIGRTLLLHRRYLGLAMALALTLHFYYVIRLALSVVDLHAELCRAYWPAR